MRKHCLNIFMTFAVIAVPGAGVGADRDQDDIKELSGISIRGDKEAPKSLYIVPWHNAELEQSTNLSSNLDGKDVRAVDRESFRQQLQLQELGKSGWYRLTPDKP